MVNSVSDTLESQVISQRVFSEIICFETVLAQVITIFLKGKRRKNTFKRMMNKANTHTVTSESCSLVRFSGWLMAVMPNSTGLADGGRKARRMALLATFMKATMACQPLLLYQTWQTKAGRIQHITQPSDLIIAVWIYDVWACQLVNVSDMKILMTLLSKSVS